MEYSTVKIRKSNRNIGIDALKGVLIILMVVGHSGVPESWYYAIYTFHMPAFFIISGYLLKYKYIDDIPFFIKRKLKTIWWPFVLWTSVFILLNNCLHLWHLTPNEYTLGEQVKFLFDGFRMVRTESLLGGFWFLRSLLFASILSAIYLKLVHFSRWGIISGILGSIVISELLLLQIIRPISFLYITFQNFEATAFFLVGVLIQSEDLVHISRIKLVVAISLLACGVSTVYIKGTMLQVTATMIFPYFLAACLIVWGLFIIFYRLPDIKVKTYLSKIGGRTLDILIFHFLTFKLVSAIKIWKYGLEWEELGDFPVIKAHMDDCFWIIYTIVALIVCYGISLIKDHVKEKFIRHCPYSLLKSS